MIRLFDRPIDTVRGLVRFLAMPELDFWYKAAWDKQTLDMDRRAIQKRDMDRRAIGVSCIWTPHFYICHFLLRYCGICYLPIFPSCRKWSWTAGENGIKMSKVQDRMLSNQKIKRVPFPIAMPRGVRVLIEVSSVYSFYVNLFIYLFIFYFAFLSEQRAPDTQKFSVH